MYSATYIGSAFLDSLSFCGFWKWDTRCFHHPGSWLVLIQCNDTWTCCCPCIKNVLRRFFVLWENLGTQAFGGHAKHDRQFRIGLWRCQSDASPTSLFKLWPLPRQIWISTSTSYRNNTWNRYCMFLAERTARTSPVYAVWWTGDEQWHCISILWKETWHSRGRRLSLFTCNVTKRKLVVLSLVQTWLELAQDGLEFGLR